MVDFLSQVRWRHLNDLSPGSLSEKAGKYWLMFSSGIPEQVPVANKDIEILNAGPSTQDVCPANFIFAGYVIVDVSVADINAPTNAFLPSMTIIFL
jgi:hypothetical protein